MSAGVSGIPQAAVADGWSRTGRAGGRSPAFAPDNAGHQAAVLHLPEEQAFKVANINDRLATTAAEAGSVGAAIDLKA